jgi:hypothetical protein
MEKDAVVKLFGCHVAEDCKGSLLLYDVARTLLKKGGTVEGQRVISELQTT